MYGHSLLLKYELHLPNLEDYCILSRYATSMGKASFFFCFEELSYPEEKDAVFQNIFLYLTKYMASHSRIQ